MPSAKPAKTENGARDARPACERLAKPITQTRLNAVMRKWKAADEAARAEMVASKDPDAETALAYIAAVEASVAEHAGARLKLLVDKAAATKTKRIATTKRQNAWEQANKSAITCFLKYTAPMLQRPQNVHTPMTDLQACYNSTGHPCPPLGQEFFGLTKDDDPVHLTSLKHVFYAFASARPQSDEIADSEMGWAWKEVQVIRLSLCKTLACVSPVVVDDRRAFGGDWGNRRVIGVPLLDHRAPAVLVLPAGYDHHQRLANIAARRDAAEAAQAAL
jgi:hypothetical protein